VSLSNFQIGKGTSCHLWLKGKDGSRNFCLKGGRKNITLPGGWIGVLNLGQRLEKMSALDEWEKGDM